MNENNFEYLRNQLKYTGFGEALEIELKEKLKQGAPSFTLYHETYPEDRVARATLLFNKAKEGDLYFFNSYNIEMKKENIADTVEHTFYVGKGGTITMKEAQNLMLGRAINKDLVSREGHGYNTWMQMDFKKTDEHGHFKLQQYHQNYGYDLLGTLDKYPIKELENDTSKEELIRSLKKGNLQGVNFLSAGKEIKHFIAADPHFKTISVYDEQMKKMDSRLCKDEKKLEVIYKVVGETKKKNRLENEQEKEQSKETAKRRQRRTNSL
jgi:hypothetical protein